MGRKPADGVYFYRNVIEIIRNLEGEQAKAFFLAVCDYMLNGEDEGFEKATPLSLLWLAIKPSLASMKQKIDAGRIGGKVTKDAERKHGASVVQAECKQSASEVQPIKNKKIRNKEIQEKKVPPSIEEVKAYCKEKGLATDPDEFYNYYEANGWKVGRNPMKDWHAALRTWEAKRKNERGVQKPQTPEQSKFIRL